VAQAALTTILLGGILAVTGLATSPAGAAGNDHQITICHATGNGGFSSPNPAKWQITEADGHGGHADDIIPAFPAGSKGSHSWGAYPGQNLSPANEAILARGCAAQAPAVGSVTLDKVTAGDGQPAGTTSFDFTVTCESGTVADPAPSITPDSPALPVAAGVAVGDSCTISEAPAGDLVSSTTFSSDGGATEHAGPFEVTVASSDQVIAVVVTNTYRCADGLVADGEGGCTTPTSEVTDACPLMGGIQASVAECPTQVKGETLTPSTPAAPSAGPAAQPTVAQPAAQPQVNAAAVGQTTPVAAVAGEQLPRTGSSTTALAEVGFGLILLGAGALLFDRKQAPTA
jgi:LPXTG-motif cell wall-anchored protein